MTTFIKYSLFLHVHLILMQQSSSLKAYKAKVWLDSCKWFFFIFLLRPSTTFIKIINKSLYFCKISYFLNPRKLTMGLMHPDLLSLKDIVIMIFILLTQTQKMWIMSIEKKDHTNVGCVTSWYVWNIGQWCVDWFEE